jgi:hypothetical protein
MRFPRFRKRLTALQLSKFLTRRFDELSDHADFQTNHTDFPEAFLIEVFGFKFLTVANL